MNIVITTHKDKTYKEVNGTFYDVETPDKVIEILENAKASGTRLKLYLGDKETGRDWMNENDTIGYIGRSTGAIKIPLLIKLDRSSGGGALLESCIVKIKRTKDNVVLWQHEKYNRKEMEIVLTDRSDLGYTHNVNIGGNLYSRHKSLRSAQMLVRKLS